LSVPLSVTGSFDAFEPGELRTFATEIESAGYTRLWVGGGFEREVLSQLAFVVPVTRTLRFGAGIVSIWTRPAVTTRIGAMSLSRLSEGRFDLGLGVSLPEAVEDGVWARPVAAMREYVNAYRGAEAGPDAPEPRLYLAALRPRMLALASELADGVALYLTPVSRVAEVRELVGPDKEIVVSVPVALGRAARERARRYVADHLAAPTYAAILGGLGLGVESFGELVATSPAQVAERVEALAAAGATEIAFQSAGGDWPKPHLETFLQLPA